MFTIIESDSDASDSPVNKKSNLPAKETDFSQHNVSNIHNEELLTEKEKLTDDLNVNIMELLKMTCQNLKSSLVFSLFRSNQYAGDVGTYFADTACTVLPEITIVNLSLASAVFVRFLFFYQMIALHSLYFCLSLFFYLSVISLEDDER